MDTKDTVIKYVDDIDRLCKTMRIVINDVEKLKLAIELMKADALQQIAQNLPFDSRMEEV